MWKWSSAEATRRCLRYCSSGYDLHEFALRRNMCRRGEVYCYDIHDRADEFRKAFDLLLMFDVLEHIEDQDRFLDSVRFLLADRGCLIINVPAVEWLFSPYDWAQGHHRRYSLASLLEVAGRNGFNVSKATYWGWPLVPVLALRKAALTIGKIRTDIHSAGFDARWNLINTGCITSPDVKFCRNALRNLGHGCSRHDLRPACLRNHGRG